jgi:hypothetical protein
MVSMSCFILNASRCCHYNPRHVIRRQPWTLRSMGPKRVGSSTDLAINPALDPQNGGFFRGEKTYVRRGIRRAKSESCPRPENCQRVLSPKRSLPAGAALFDRSQYLDTAAITGTRCRAAHLSSLWDRALESTLAHSVHELLPGSTNDNEPTCSAVD